MHTFSHGLNVQSSPGLIAALSQRLFTCGMQTIDQIRHANFLLLLASVGGSGRAMAERIGISAAQVSQIKNQSPHSITGRPRIIGDDLARKIEAALDLQAGAMDAPNLGDRQASPLASSSNAQPETARPYPGGNRIPVVGSAQLGDNGHFVELEYPVGHGDGWVDVASRDPNAYALRCRGDSMKPRIQSGEFVVVEPNTEVSPGDEVLVKATDGRVMIKKYLYRREGRVHLVSVNEAHPSIALEEREVAAMHYVGAIVKASRWGVG